MGSGLQRQSTLYPHGCPKDYGAAFDSDTLWYDAIQRKDQLLLICPKLNNLTSSIRSAQWWVDRRRVYLKDIYFYHRHDILRLQVPPRQARQITIQIGSWVSHCNITQAQPQLFHGLNAMLVINKNNKLEWIVDFIRFYVHNHKLEGLILMDNSSTIYDCNILEDTLRQFNLKMIIVVAAPFKFGSCILGLNPVYEELYLQCALLNIMRLRYLSKARAVVNCDIDELAFTPKTTIFDLVKRNPWGFVMLPVVWRYSDPTDQDPTRQAAHRFKHLTIPELESVKWCVVPQGVTSWFPLCWDVHWLSLPEFGNTFRLRLIAYILNRGINYIFKHISMIFYPECKFFHCFSTTTGWKAHRQSPPERELVPDPEWSATLDAALSPPRTACRD